MMKVVLLVLLCFTCVLLAKPHHPEELIENGYIEKLSIFRNEELFEKDLNTVILRKQVPKARHLMDLQPYFDLNMQNPLYAKSLENHKAMEGAYPLPGEFWHFLPIWVTSIVPGAAPYSWSADCFENNTVWAEQDSDGDFKLHFEISGKKSLFCDDGYWLVDVKDFHIHYFEIEGHHTIDWNGPFLDDEKYDILANGFRMYKFNETLTYTIVDVWETIDLFWGALTGAQVPNWTAADNLEFMKNYMNFTMEPRTTNLVDIPLDYIKSGDYLGVIRLDGLDPFLAWGMGSRTGHATIVMWHDDGNLYVHESTVHDSYWPTNGIQVHPWDEWVQLAMTANYNVVHLPLSDESRAKFNVTAALEFFDQHEGLPYGYHNMLFCWLDTPEGNYPLPMNSQMVMVLMAITNEIKGSNTSTDIFAQALNHRINTKGLTVSEAYYEAGKQGINFTELVSMPEMDDWIYENEGGPSGRSMICEVFVLSMYKAGGLFGNLSDVIQVTEFTDFDAYALNFFNSTSVRPQVCVDADPTLPYCQLMGLYRMELLKWNTMEIYPNMREHCPTIPPAYIQPQYC